MESDLSRSSSRASTCNAHLTNDTVVLEPCLRGDTCRDIEASPTGPRILRATTRSDRMRIVSVGRVIDRLGALSGEEPRVVVSGNFATPMGLLHALEASRERCRLFAINAQADWPQRSGSHQRDPVRRARHAP